MQLVRYKLKEGKKQATVTNADANVRKLYAYVHNFALSYIHSVWSIDDKKILFFHR